MKITSPIADQIKDSKNILILGVGGGFDIFGGLPLFFELSNMGKNVLLSNYSTSVLEPEDFHKLKNDNVASLRGIPYVKGVSGPVIGSYKNYPEGYLAEWFDKHYKKLQTIWMFYRTGVRPLRKSLEQLTSEMQADTVIAVDCGVDALMHGDETHSGTFLDDAITLAALDDIAVPTKILACVGFGTEVEEGLSHRHALQNMAELVHENAFYGCSSLNKNQTSFRLYEKACRYVWSQPGHRKSHIHTRIIPAVYGEFGDYKMFDNIDPQLTKVSERPVCISPLMSLYWFFNANISTKKNLLNKKLKLTSTHVDASIIWREFANQTKMRESHLLPY